MSPQGQNPAVFKILHGKVPPEVEQVFKLLFDGLQDNKQAVIALKGQHDTVAKQVTTNTTGVATANKTANTALTATQQPVAAGQQNAQSATYILQQTDHLGLVQLTGTTAAQGVTLNNLVQYPFTARISNGSSQSWTLTPTAGTVNGGASYTLTAGSVVSAYFDGTNWQVV